MTKMKLSRLKRLTGLELNDVLFNKILPKKLFDRSRITSSGTLVYDLNGETLFHRVPIRKGKNQISFADIAVNSQLGSPLLSISYGQEWNQAKVVKEAKKQAVKKRRGIKFNKIKFVAYSYPKIAVQFLMNTKEILMLELFSWEIVPKAMPRSSSEPPSNFERWSLLDELPQDKKRKNIKKFEKRIKQWDDICPPDRTPKWFKPEFIRIKEFSRLVKGIEIRPKVISRELHFSPELSDHSPCYEVLGQLTGVWCVAASCQMLLDFYRYNYDQDRLATDLDLGTRAAPNGLPWARIGDVVTVIENLTSNALDVTMNLSPSWTEFCNEIRANRPLISFIWGHSRTVAGYTSGLSVLGGTFRGLLVYDPWPPSTTGQPTSGGTITRWENFDTQTYVVTYVAQLTLV